ncbi:basic proline-rich protein-like [Dromiciops gliroides]|uniref:basic proline-rich protein-like n=1 Tax=Dromiciops gliroides TaxID=33562 RepID=UPI001CC5B097|nr:basic proline-rich protein-like [Dromiciops gliroides]
MSSSTPTHEPSRLSHQGPILNKNGFVMCMGFRPVWGQDSCPKAFAQRLPLLTTSPGWVGRPLKNLKGVWGHGWGRGPVLPAPGWPPGEPQALLGARTTPGSLLSPGTRPGSQDGRTTPPAPLSRRGRLGFRRPRPCPPPPQSRCQPGTEDRARGGGGRARESAQSGRGRPGHIALPFPACRPPGGPHPSRGSHPPPAPIPTFAPPGLLGLARPGLWPAPPAKKSVPGKSSDDRSLFHLPGRDSELRERRPK